MMGWGDFAMRFSSLFVVAGCLIACQPKAKDSGAAKGDDPAPTESATDSTTDTATDTSTEATGTDTGTDTQAGVVLVATDLGDLSLSQALGFAPPASVLATGEAVAVDGSGNVAITTALADPEKSYAACQVRRRIKMGMKLLREISKDLCYVENDVGSLPFDKKYKIMHSETESKSIWAQKHKDKITVSFCENDTLVYEFTVTGVKDGKAAGSFRSVRTEAGVTHFVDSRFDNHLLVADRLGVSIKHLEHYVDGSAQNRRHLAMSLEDADVSFVASTLTEKYMHPTTDAFTTVKTSSFAKFGPRLGQVVTYRSGDLDGDGSLDAQGEVFRAGFDAAGNSLRHDAAIVFKPGGKLRVEASSMPKPLGDDYDPKPFGEDSWDCSGAETVDPVGTNEQYLVCDEIPNGTADEDCDGLRFADDEAPDLAPFATPGTDPEVY